MALLAKKFASSTVGARPVSRRAAVRVQASSRCAESRVLWQFNPSECPVGPGIAFVPAPPTRHALWTALSRARRVDRYSKNDIIVSPSILSADFSRLGDEVRGGSVGPGLHAKGAIPSGQGSHCGRKALHSALLSHRRLPCAVVPQPTRAARALNSLAEGWDSTLHLIHAPGTPGERPLGVAPARGAAAQRGALYGDFAVLAARPSGEPLGSGVPRRAGRRPAAPARSHATGAAPNAAIRPPADSRRTPCLLYTSRRG